MNDSKSGMCSHSLELSYYGLIKIKLYIEINMYWDGKLNIKWGCVTSYIE